VTNRLLSLATASYVSGNLSEVIYPYEASVLEMATFSWAKEIDAKTNSLLFSF